MRMIASIAVAVAVAATVGAAQGAVAQTCALTVGTAGRLGLSSDGTVLGSGEGAGLGGTITILSIGTNTIDVTAPDLVAAPAGYMQSGQRLEVAYAGLGGLAAIAQVYTDTATQFSVGTIGLSILQINNRIVNPNGFAAGGYITGTVVTCE